MKKLFILLLSFLFVNVIFMNEINANELTPQQNIAICTDLIKKNPKDAEAYSFRALFKGMIGDTKGCLKDVNYALKLNPSLANAYYVRGSAYCNLAEGLEAGPNELRTKAINDYTKCLELGGPRADAYYWRGAVRKTAKEYDAAISDLTIVINMKPKDAEAYFQRGLCYFFKKDTKAAFPDFKKAVELNPKNEEYQKYFALF